MNARERAAWKQKLEGMRREALGKKPVRIEPNRKDATDTGVADEDAQALSEMLQAIGSQRNKGQAERLGQQARQRVQRYFLVNRHLTQYFRLLEQLVH